MLNIRRKGSAGVQPERRRVDVQKHDVLIYRGMEIDQDTLDAILSTNKRLLWAFVRGCDGNIMAVPYDESRVVWLLDSDLHQPNDVEV